jgi:hypothetical protein
MRNSSVRTNKGYGLDSWVSIRDKGKRLSTLYSAQAGYGAHPTLLGKECETDHSFP